MLGNKSCSCLDVVSPPGTTLAHFSPRLIYLRQGVPPKWASRGSPSERSAGDALSINDSRASSPHLTFSVSLPPRPQHIPPEGPDQALREAADSLGFTFGGPHIQSVLLLNESH
ncbi:unnamed protein product [Lota lota]